MMKKDNNKLCDNVLCHELQNVLFVIRMLASQILSSDKYDIHVVLYVTLIISSLILNVSLIFTHSSRVQILFLFQDQTIKEIRDKPNG